MGSVEFLCLGSAFWMMKIERAVGPIGLFVVAAAYDSSTFGSLVVMSATKHPFVFLLWRMKPEP